MGSYLGDLLRIIRLKILIEKVKPYKTVKLTFLARVNLNNPFIYYVGIKYLRK
jgi:hypothetical protein